MHVLLCSKSAPTRGLSLVFCSLIEKIGIFIFIICTKSAENYISVLKCVEVCKCVKHFGFKIKINFLNFYVSTCMSMVYHHALNSCNATAVGVVHI